jgi:hypothetical protein
MLSLGSTQIAAKAIAAEFEKQTGHKVTLLSDHPHGGQGKILAC